MSIKLETRIAVLEQQVARLQQQQLNGPAGREWLDDLYGKFSHDQVFKKAMNLGRKYRRSLRTRVAKGDLQR